MEHLDDQEVDICFVQETWLKEADAAKLQEIRDYGWDIISNPRKHRTGGGIAFLSRRGLNLKANEKVIKYNSCQIMETVLNTTSGIIRLINVYRPGYSKKARHTVNDFLEEFEGYLSDLVCKSGTPILAGDFNFHIQRPHDPEARKFLDLLDHHDLHQIVPPVPTHNLGGTLDLVITTKALKDQTNPIRIIKSGTSSDHYLVIFEMMLTVVPSVSVDGVKVINYRDFNSIQLEDFKNDLIKSRLGNSSEWNNCDLDEAVSLYNVVLTELMDKHCPVIEKKVKDRDRPWIDEELRQLRRKRRAAERAWRKGKGDKQTYINLRNRFTHEESQKRCIYNRNALMASAGDTKALYKKINRLIGNSTKSLPASSLIDPLSLSEDFKDFFSGKVSKIRQDIEEEGNATNFEGNESPELVEDDKEDVNCRLEELSPISLEELKELISGMSNKFCNLDPIPSFLLKKCVDELSPILLHIVNLSVSHGQFPTDMKTAIVKPTLKNESFDPDCLKNYRPVSNLPAISKLLERVVLNQLNMYLGDNDLHCPVQSGYRPNHSCETLLVRMSDDILREVHNDNIVIVVLLDLSAAFDTIDHSILLDKLLNQFGIHGNALKWFRSYLENRSFCVKIDKALSDFLCLLFGVPQGSLLGPILFILYIKYIQWIAAKYGLSIQLYADDSQLYISFHPSRPSELHEVIDSINKCLAEIKQWMVKNYMKLNESKTELMVIGKPLVLRRFDLEVTIQFGNTVIKPTDCCGDKWKSLGVKLDQSLNMERQISQVKQKCNWTMTNLRTIGRYLDERVKLMLVKQLVISKLDYCNALYMNLAKKRLKKLKSILNGGIRFIYNVTDRNVDLIPYYKKAHILPIEQRIFFKVCLLAYKIVNDSAPDYLQQLVQHEVSGAGRTRSTSTDDHYRLKIPKMSKLKASDRRFTYYAPESWNSLPLRLRSICDVSSFKRMLKNYLYEQL